MGVVSTILVPTLGEEPAVLERAVNSYLAQSVPVTVLISTVSGDPSLDLVGYSPAIEFSVMDKADHPGRGPRGVMAQITHAVHDVRTRSFCFMSGNDTAVPEKIEIEDRLLSDSVHVVVSAYRRHNVNEDGSESVWTWRPKPFCPNTARTANQVHDCSLVSLRLWQELGGLRLEYGNSVYWDFWWRAFEAHGPGVFAYNPVPTWDYLILPTSQHILAQSDPDEMAVRARDRAAMVSSHA